MRAVAAVAALAALAFCAGKAPGQELLIRDAKVHTVTSQGTLEHADVLVRQGVIVAVGKGLSANPGAEVIEAGNRPLTPGLFAGLSAIGLAEVQGESSTVDGTLNLGAPAWQQQWRPEFDVTLAYNPRSTVVPVTRIEGLTWTVLAPSGNHIMAGQGAAVTLDGRYDAVLPGSRTLFVSLRSGGMSGGSRAAHYMLLDQAIREVRGGRTTADHALLLPAGREALKSYLSGGRVIFGVDRAADIRQTVAFARRHGLKPVISGGAEAWLVAEELARAEVPVILDALVNLPYGFDSLGARLDNAALLHSAGVKIVFSSGQTHNARKVRQLAGNAVAHGLPWEAALAAITANPADVFGLGRTRGRIAAGQIADLVLWSDDPLEVTSVAERVWIAGVPVEMRSRQTELRDRHFGRLEAARAGQAVAGSR
ncbi:MAG TPA: amidohydrolase family protein [Vicinamibacterales bacterium]